MAADWLRAPQEDGAIIARPGLGEVGALLAENRRRLAVPSRLILGRRLADLQQQARQEVIAAANQYLRDCGEPTLLSPSGGLIVAGHQPELFHPGVWVKNFALNGLARRHGLTSLHLVVDNDTVNSTALRIPQRNDAVHLGSVAFDRQVSELPYEEQKVHDEELFATFPDRAGPLLQPWGYPPLLPSFWKEVVKQRERTPFLGERFVAARRSVERLWGCHNLELPASRLSETATFADFAHHILLNLPRFHAVYNSALADYRRQHGIRSRNHPVPELTRNGEWWETPFWGWEASWEKSENRRGRLFARVEDGTIGFQANGQTWPADTWRALRSLGFKIRPRALTLTLFARLFLADLFIHGIGGGKYDLLTDEIIRRFYGLEPPGFLVLSATLHLPLPTYPATVSDRRRLAHELRDLRWNPQRHLDYPALRPLIEEKQRWIDLPTANAPERRQRFEQIRRLSEQLQDRVAGRADEVRTQLERCDRELAANAVLRRRDYAFCLYPEEKLRVFMAQFLAPG